MIADWHPWIAYIVLTSATLLCVAACDARGWLPSSFPKRLPREERAARAIALAAAWPLIWALVAVVGTVIGISLAYESLVRWLEPGPRKNRRVTRGPYR